MAALNKVNPEPGASSSSEHFQRRRDHSPDRPKKINDYFEEPDYGVGVAYDPKFQGPVRNRKCTDIICLVLFFVFLGAWGVVAYFAVQRGDIERIIYPTDSKGQICGRGELQNRPLLLFFDLTKCLNPAVLAIGCPTTQVCVSACPTEQYSGYGASLAPAANKNQDHIKEKMRPFCQRLSKLEWDSMTPAKLIELNHCPAWTLPSTSVLGRCLPTIVSTENKNNNPNATVFDENENPGGKPINQATVSSAVTALGAFLQVRGFGERIFTDISATWWMICVALLVAAITSFFWIILMRFFTRIMIWTSIGLVFTLFGGLFGYTLYKYIVIKDQPTAQGNIFQVNFTPDYGKDVLALANTWLAFCIICGIIFLIIFLLLIALRQRILIAIELIEQGSRAVGQMFSTLFFPLGPFCFQIVVVLFFAGVAVYLSSAGEPEYRISYPLKKDAFSRDAMAMTAPCDHSCQNPDTNKPFNISDICDPKHFKESCQCTEIECQFTMYTKPSGTSWMVWFNLFGFYWGMFFVAAFSELTLAGVFATWYWTWNKKDVPMFVLPRFFGIVIFYHLGTVAFGSLIIAIIRMIRTVVSYIESKLKAYNNDLVKCLICVCKCCLYCLEKFMKFINRNAYIMCAIKSTNFCTSAKDAFNLLMRNLVRVVVLNKVVEFLLFLGKLVVTTGVGCLAYFTFTGGITVIKDDIPTLNYFQTPIVIIVIGTYFISSSFFSVYSMAVDTLFLCFLEDLERNDGSPEKPYYMSRGLQKVIGKMNKIKNR